MTSVLSQAAGSFFIQPTSARQLKNAAPFMGSNGIKGRKDSISVIQMTRANAAQETASRASPVDPPSSFLDRASDPDRECVALQIVRLRSRRHEGARSASLRWQSGAVRAARDPSTKQRDRVPPARLPDLRARPSL